jgi:hypothetical protein
VRGQVLPDQRQLADSLRSNAQAERRATVRSILAIPPADRQFSLEVALAQELSRLRAQRQRDEGDYLFSLIEAVSQSKDPNIVRALVPWLRTGNRAINAVTALGELSVLDVTTIARDPGNDDAPVALLVMGRLLSDPSRYPLTAVSRRSIVETAELRLSGTQPEAVVEEAVYLAIATGDSRLIERVESLAQNAAAVRDFGISDPESVAYLQKRAADALARRKAR